MHVHKPADAMLLLGYQSRGGQPSLTVTIGYCRRMDGEPVTEQDAWKILTKIFTDEPFDLSQKKLRRGWGVAGSAMAPAGTPVSGLTVRASVGSMQKSLLVLGDRVWTRGMTGWQPSAPQPFTAMPIGLSRAYGAKPLQANPHGRGHFADPDDAEGKPLPNIEDPHAPVLRPADRPQPATLGILAQSDRAQTRWLGTLDPRWRRERLPWLPDDTDPRWFDRFPQEQCQDGYWRGDESWFAENMNAARPALQGSLPGLRPRLFARTDAAPEQRFELPLDLDTVWLLPNEAHVLVLYRAALATRREDAEDVLGLGIFTERMAEPAKAPEHWAAVWRQAIEEEAKPAPAAPIAPAPEAAEKSAQVKKQVEEFGKAATDHRALVAQTVADARQSAHAEAEQTLQRHGFGALQGRPPREGFPVDAAALPAPAVWPTEPAAFKAAVKQYVADALAAGAAENRKQWQAYGLDYDAAVARANARPAAALDPADAILKSRLPAERKAALLQQYQAFQIKMDALELKAADMEKQAKSLQEQAQTPAEPPVPDAALPVGPRARLDRDSLLARHARRETARWSELQDLDLSGADLSGIDLRAGLLRQCNLRGANLEGADFTDCSIEDCDFSGARLAKARFTRAQLTACQAPAAALPAADFTQAVLAKCTFAQADLSGTQWIQARLKECEFDKADLRQAQGREANFAGCGLARADASAAAFPRATFSKSILEGTTLTGAMLAGATLLSCQAAGARFDDAELSGLRTLKGTDLSKASLHRAHLYKASLQDTDLQGASLRETRMDRGFIKNCNLSDTDAWHLVARACDFTGSRILQARWRGANLMKARLRQTVLQDVDLTGANLHAADTRTASVQGLQLQQALLTRCRLLEDYAHD